jgi:hypothetical protein
MTAPGNTTRATIKAILGLLLLVLPAIGFEDAPKLPIIATRPQAIVGKFRFGQGRAIEISGTAIYAISQMNSDITFSGQLRYMISESSRQEIAEQTGLPIAQVLTRFEKNDLVAAFGKSTYCPDIRLTFAPLELAVGEDNLSLARYTLVLPETEHLVSRMICICARHNQDSRTGCRVVKQINWLLSGKRIEDYKSGN